MFIPNNHEEGRRIRLTANRSALNGKFTCGHEFTITGSSYRGFDLIDDDGNRLLETMMYVPSDGFEFID